MVEFRPDRMHRREASPEGRSSDRSRRSQAGNDELRRASRRQAEQPASASSGESVRGPQEQHTNTSGNDCVINFIQSLAVQRGTNDNVQNQTSGAGTREIQPVSEQERSFQRYTEERRRMQHSGPSTVRLQFDRQAPVEEENKSPIGKEVDNLFINLNEKNNNNGQDKDSNIRLGVLEFLTKKLSEQKNVNKKKEILEEYASEMAANRYVLHTIENKGNTVVFANNTGQNIQEDLSRCMLDLNAMSRRIRKNEEDQKQNPSVYEQINIIRAIVGKPKLAYKVEQRRAEPQRLEQRRPENRRPEQRRPEQQRTLLQRFRQHILRMLCFDSSQPEQRLRLQWHEPQRPELQRRRQQIAEQRHELQAQLQREQVDLRAMSSAQLRAYAQGLEQEVWKLPERINLGQQNQGELGQLMTRLLDVQQHVQQQGRDDANRRDLLSAERKASRSIELIFDQSRPPEQRVERMDLKAMNPTQLDLYTRMLEKQLPEGTNLGQQNRGELEQLEEKVLQLDEEKNRRVTGLTGMTEQHMYLLEIRNITNKIIKSIDKNLRELEQQKLGAMSSAELNQYDQEQEREVRHLLERTNLGQRERRELEKLQRKAQLLNNEAKQRSKNKQDMADAPITDRIIQSTDENLVKLEKRKLGAMSSAELNQYVQKLEREVKKVLYELSKERHLQKGGEELDKLQRNAQLLETEAAQRLKNGLDGADRSNLNSAQKTAERIKSMRDVAWEPYRLWLAPD